MPTTLWVQEWEESERGWGVRPDGYTLHRDKEDIDKFLASMRKWEEEHYKGRVPDAYSRPSGNPYAWTTDDEELVAGVVTSEAGIWGPGRKPPEREPAWVAEAKAAGWTPPCTPTGACK